MKKILIGLAGLVFVVLVAIVVLPFVIDVDHYRPQMVSAVNDRINGKLELGKLSLSLWGQIRVEVAGVDLKDSTGNSILAVKDAYFHVPFSSILSGEPLLTLKMQSPNVNVIKDQSGRINVLGLMKEEVSKDGSSSDVAPKAPVTGTQQVTSLPGIMAKARLGIEFRNAVLMYQDETTGLDSRVRDLNVVLKDISLNRPTAMELWADLDTKMGKTFSFKGPVRLTATAKPEWVSGKLGPISVQANLDLDQLEISAQQMFHKRRGIPAHASVAVAVSEKEAKIEQFLAKFFNVDLKANGSISNLGGGKSTSGPVVNMQLQSNEIAVGPWVELVPMLKEYELGGNIKLSAEANGPSDRLGYRAKLGIYGVTAKAPKIKGPPRIDGTIDIATDRVENLALTIKAPGTDLEVRGKVISFMKPQIDMAIQSQGIDLDRLVDLPPPEQQSAASIQASGSSKKVEIQGDATRGDREDKDALLDPLRENKSAQDTSANLAVNIRFLKAYGIKVTDIVSKLSFRDLTLAVEKFAMRLWDGSLEVATTVQMKPKTPTYRFKAKVAGLDLQQAVSSQLHLLRNTVVGKAHFEMSGEGSSFNADAAKINLRASGKMHINQATFASIDVGRMATEALNKAIEKVGEKVPQAKGRSLGTPPGRTSRYEMISSDFSISGGKFSAPNFFAKAAKNDGIDIKGDTTVSLVDLSLKTSWELIDTYNLTKARDLSVEANGVRVEHLLAEGDQPVRFPVHAGCTMAAPCYSYTEVPEHLAKVAVNNLSSALQNKAKEELKNRAQSIIQQNLPPAAQNPLNDLKKKFFR